MQSPKYNLVTYTSIHNLYACSQVHPRLLQWKYFEIVKRPVQIFTTARAIFATKWKSEECPAKEIWKDKLAEDAVIAKLMNESS